MDSTEALRAGALGEIDFRAVMDARRRKKRETAKALVAGVVSGDERAFRAAWGDAQLYGGFPEAIRALGRLPTPISAEAQAIFLGLWIAEGDELRPEAGDDLALIRALRNLLPPYRGPAMRLWRGEWAGNRRRRTYSLSWTADRSVACAFAEAYQEHAAGGTMLLEADVSPSAIICAPGLLGDHLSEAEYLVDRRKLRSVRVLQRWPNECAPFSGDL